MNRDQAKQYAEMMLAWADGKPIEFRRKEDVTWGVARMSHNLLWDFQNFEYRFPKKKVYRVRLSFAFDPARGDSYAFDTMSDAEDFIRVLKKAVHTHPVSSYKIKEEETDE